MIQSDVIEYELKKIIIQEPYNPNPNPKSQPKQKKNKDVIDVKPAK